MPKQFKYKRAFLCLPLLMFHCIINAQFSIQLSPGIINYGGDLQNKIYTFKQAGFSVGGALMYSVNKFSLRAGLTYGKVEGDDLSNTGYKQRNLSFKSSISEASLSLEYDLFLLNEERKFTPYVFAGVGAFHFNPYTTYDSQTVYLRPLGTEGQGLSAYPDKKVYSLMQVAIPLGIGVKYKVSEHILLGFEFNSRFLLTDYLDDVSGTYADENELYKGRGQFAVDVSYRGDEINSSLPYPSGQTRGNPKHNDNYYTTSFTITYVFSNHSLFSGNGNGKKGKQVGCPKRIQ